MEKPALTGPPPRLAGPQTLALRTPHDTRIAAEAEARASARRFAVERRRQLLVLTVAAAVALVTAILLAGPRNIFLPGWWHIDLP